MLILLLISVWINYIDRGNLSVAAPLLAPELGLGPRQMGLLFSAFFWTYSAFQVVSGWLIDRGDVGRIYAGAFALWSFATLATGIVHGFAALFALRLLLGIGESAAYPAYSRILATAFPEDRRGFANALVDVGTKAGPAAGLFIGGLLVETCGWRFLFLAIGGASLLWLIPWLIVAPSSNDIPRRAEGGPSLGEILRRRQPWVTFLGLFGFNYAFYFLLTWLPSYLVNERQFSVGKMAVYGALPYAVTAAMSLLCGWQADRRISQGGSPGLTRQAIAVAGLVLAAVTLPMATVKSDAVAMVWFVLAFAGVGMFTSCIWAITQTLAGPLAAGRWTGLQNAFGNLGGVVAPLATGWIVGARGTYELAFVAAAAMLFVAAICYGLLLGRARPVEWPKTAKTGV
jgi:MFS family permease